LGNSNISGSLGPELGRLVNLKYLELYRNNFDGEIPKELGNLKNLISLDLYANKLTGEIPNSLSKLNLLRFMYDAIFWFANSKNMPSFFIEA
jgi:Leucine-rich repeat (LRR) protein